MQLSEPVATNEVLLLKAMLKRSQERLRNRQFINLANCTATVNPVNLTLKIARFKPEEKKVNQQPLMIFFVMMTVFGSCQILFDCIKHWLLQ